MRTSGINSKKCTMYMNIDEKDKHVGWNLHFHPFKRDLFNLMFCFPSVRHVICLREFPLCLFTFYLYICTWIRQNLKKISHVKRKNKGQALRGQSNQRAITREIRKLTTMEIFFSFPQPPCSSQQLKLLLSC